MASAEGPEDKSDVKDLRQRASEPTEDFLLRENARNAAKENETLEPTMVGRKLGRFHIVARLGVGGMGEVYLAEDSSLRRNVALKVLPGADATDQERRRRFLREARAATAVVHPNITTIYEVGTVDGLDYIAMEHVKGKTLRQVLGLREDPLPIAEALRIAHEIARGLGKAHEVGVVHRDIKSDNVMLDETGHVKVLDFGLAKWVEPTRSGAALHGASTVATLEGQILGTPSYMSPEQAEGKSLDARTDVFSLAVMLYEMVTGRLPFTGTTPMAMMISVSRDEPTPLTKYRKDVPKALEALIYKCLDKNPEMRLSSGNDVAEALEALLSNPNKLVVATSKVALVPVAEAAPESIARPVKPRTWIALVALPLIASAIFGGAYWLRSAPTSEPLDTNTPAQGYMRVCLNAEDVPLTCQGGLQWCDATGRQAVCCGEGLVPRGADNLCSCAQGGTNVAAAIARGCKESTETEDQRERRRMDLIGRVTPCFDAVPALREIADGNFAATYMLTEDGAIVAPSVRKSDIPNERAQACALEAMRTAHFPPPRAEDVGRVLAFGFTYASLPDLEKRLRRDGGAEPMASAAVPSASASSASVSSAPPLRFPCATPPSNWPCTAPNEPWCDSADKPIACCARGLIAVGTNGLCGCPPGGVEAGPGAPLGCPIAKPTSTTEVQKLIRTHFQEFRACYENTLRKLPKAEGRVSVQVLIGPEGRVFKTRVMDASLPDPEAQTCLLEAFQKIIFEPPPNGTMTIGYPIVFTPG
jgi:TonB family protein